MRIISIPATAVALFIAAPSPAAPTNLAAQQSTIKYSKTATGASGYSNYVRAPSRTVVYDQAIGSYVLSDTSTPSIKSTFGAVDIDANTSTAVFTAYRKAGGAETFRVLNQNSSNPLIALSYVSFGEWKRQSGTTTTTVNDTYLVFGKKTAVLSVPRTGTASYNTIFDGSFVNSAGARALTGSGSITANFGTGALGYSASISGLATSALAFNGSGSINFNNGSFTGRGSTSGYTMNLYGGFYGPAAQEVGGLFRLTGNGGNGQGAFVGQSAPATTTTPPPPTADPTYTGGTMQGMHGWVEYLRATDGTLTLTRIPDQTTTNVVYDPTYGSYKLYSGKMIGSSPEYTVFMPSNIVAAQSNATYTFYRKPISGGSDTFRLSKRGSGNPVIALSYMNWGVWMRTGTYSAGVTSNAQRYMVFGDVTPYADMPKSGSASYNSVIDGMYQTPAGTYAISGTGQIVANFGMSTISYSAAPVGTLASTGQTLNFGTFNGQGSMYYGGLPFIIDPTISSNGQYKMTGQGEFFGPQASEVGMVFSITQTSGSGFGSGVMVGKRN